MAKGIYVGVDKTHELSEFTSSRAPINWTDSGNGKTATATNSYGEWKITASQIQDATSYNTINAFDTSEYSFWNSGNLSSDTDFVWCGIYLPEGLSINPKKFSLRYDDFRNAHIQGLNEATEAWENIASLTDTSSMLSVTPAVTTTNYYKAFRIAGYRYSSTYKNPALDSFQITAGTMKIPNIKNNIARKVTKVYIGVDSVARKAKKGYIGVGGVARPFFSSEPELSYYGTASDLSVARYNLAATSVGDYALFGGGGTSANAGKNTVDSYTSSLVKGTASDLSGSPTSLAATSVGNYALFGGGRGGSAVYIKYVRAYNASLTMSSPSNLSVARYNLAATSVGNYALFGGGYDGSDRTSTVDTYTSSLVKGTATNLSVTRYNLAATSVGNYALFGGGSAYTTAYNATVDTYTSSLVKGTATNLSVGRSSLAATSVGDYALFAGGDNNGGGTYYSTVDTYTSSLVKGTTTNLSVTNFRIGATSVGDYALFGGGYDGSDRTSTVDTYTSSLVKGTATNLSVARNSLAATSVGNYALFGGGYAQAGANAVVDVYQVA